MTRSLSLPVPARRRIPSIGHACFLWLLTSIPATNGFAQVADQSQATTVADALKVIDLRTWPLGPGAKPLSKPSLARLYFESQGDTKSVFEAQAKQFKDKGWEEVPGGYRSDRSSTTALQYRGHVISLSVFDGGKAGSVSVLISNHGNVDLKTLPIPEGAKPFYSSPSVVSYITDVPVPETTKACRELLLAKGWQPYGDAANQHFFKKNAVRLSAFIHPAPAQAGKTVLDYSSSLMTVDLPAPADTIGFQFAENQIIFDSKSSRDELVEFYKTTLRKAGWAPTHEQLTKSGFQEFMIFRNPQKEMLTLEAFDFEKVLRVKLKYETAQEIAALERQYQEKIAQQKMEKPKTGPIVEVKIPQDAREIEQTKSRIEFKLDSGHAKTVVDAMRKELVADGWKEKVVTLEDLAGTVYLQKGEQDFSISYTDTGVIPAEVKLHAIIAEIVRSTEKK